MQVKHRNFFAAATSGNKEKAISSKFNKPRKDEDQFSSTRDWKWVKTELARDSDQ